MCFSFYLSVAAMESTESYEAGSPEELAKRSPEPHDSSEAGILIRSGLLFIPSLHFPSTLTQMLWYIVNFVNLDLV